MRNPVTMRVAGFFFCFLHFVLSDLEVNLPYNDLASASGLAQQRNRMSVEGFKAVPLNKNKYNPNTAIPISIRFISRVDKLYERATKIKPIEGFTDIVSHGDSYSFLQVDADGNERIIPADEFAEMIKQSPDYKGGNIRLIACDAAGGDAISAHTIADRLGVKVMAATKTVYVDFDGNMRVSSDGIKQDGEWVIIEPKETKKK